MAQNIFKGLGVALITPFNTDGSVDYQNRRQKYTIIVNLQNKNELFFQDCIIFEKNLYYYTLFHVFLVTLHPN